MAMELQLSTSKAQAELRAVEALVQRLGASLQSVNAAGAVFSQAGQGTNVLAGAAASAVSTIRNLNQALSTVAGQATGLTAQLNNAAAAANNFANQANRAGGGMARFGGALGSVNSLLSAFGITIGAIGFAKLAKQGYDMVNVFESFKTVVGATSGGAQVANDELDHIRKTAIRLKIDIESTTQAYGKFLAAQAGAGQETAVSRDQFTRLSEVFRVMGLTSDRTRLAFLAIEQMVSKGSISMEELRRQLGESVPAFGILAQAMGVTTKELDSMIRTGSVLTSDALPKLVDGLHQAYVNSESMSRALQKPVSVITDLSNGLKMLSFEALNAFFAQATSGMTAFAEAMRSDQAIHSFQILGQVAGAALGIIAHGLAFATQNAYIFVPALTAVSILLGVTAVRAIGAFIASMAAATLATLRFTAATVGMAVLQGTITTLATAWRLLAAAATLAWVAMGPLGRIAAVAIAAGAGLALMTGNASAATGMMGQMAEAVGGTVENLVTMEGAADVAGQAIDMVGLISGRASAEQLGLGDNIILVEDAMYGSGAAARSYAGSLDSLSYAADRAASSLRSAKSASSGGWSDGGGSLYGSRSGGTEELGSDWWASDVDYFGGSKEMGWDEPSFAGGGLVSRPTRFARVNSSYRSAPRLATGTANSNAYGGTTASGGIPALLHANEAVVPLPNGQSIPVSMGGAMAEVYACLKDIKKIMATTHQSVVNVGVLIKNESDRHFNLLQNMNNGIYKIAENMTRLSSGSGGGGGGYSGGGSYGGMSGGLSDIQDLLYRAQVATQEGMQEYSNRSYKLHGVEWAKQHYDEFSQYRSIMAEITVALQRLSESDRKAAEGLLSKMGVVDNTPLGRAGRQYASYSGVYTGGLQQGILPQFTGKSVLGFADGSPNAWKDATGGFTATLHPNEAVVPLPDGRSIPVDFSSANASEESGFTPSGNSGSGRRPVVVNVEMNVYAQDAGSFNRSKDQMMQDLSKKLNKAARSIGRSSPVDDPTRRQPE